MIVPGRAFTRDGKRIGRGGGWYDRLLSSSPDLYKMGVCFDFQVFDDLPIEEHDVVMDEVIST